jgi:hypothetical protein
VKSKLPRARVVTGDGLILGAVRQLWTDATESVVEVLQAAATAKLAEQNPPEPKPTPAMKPPPNPPRTLNGRNWHQSLSAYMNDRNWHQSFMYALNDTMRRNNIPRKILGGYRSELAGADVARVKHLPCGTTVEVSVSDVFYQRFRRDGLVGEVGRLIINEPCPKCSRDVTVPEAVTLGED